MAKLEGKKLDIRAVDPVIPVIIGLDADPINADSPLYDEERLPLLEEDDEDMLRLVDNIDATGKCPGLIRIAWTKALVHDEDGQQEEKEVPAVASGRRRIVALRVVNARRHLRGAEPIMATCAVVEDGSDNATLWGEVVGENEFRVGDTTLAKAHRANRALASGLTVAQVAALYGVVEGTVEFWQTLTLLTPHAQQLVEDGELPAATAAQLKGLEPEDMDAAADKLVAEATTTVAHARAVRQATTGDGPGIVAPSKKVVGDMLAAVSSSDVAFNVSESFVNGALWAAGLLSTEGASVIKADHDLPALLVAVEAFQASKKAKRGKTPEEKAAEAKAKADEKAKAKATKAEEKAAKAKAAVDAKEAVVKAKAAEAALLKQAKEDAAKVLTDARAKATALRTAAGVVAADTKPGKVPA